VLGQAEVCAGAAESLLAEYRRKIIRYTDASVESVVCFYCFSFLEEEVNFAFSCVRLLGHVRGQKSGSILEARVVGFLCLDGGCCVLTA